MYLISGAILGFVGDVGGPPLLRLGFTTIGPASLGLGALIGTLCALGQAEWAFFCVAVLTGMVYALVENCHSHMVMVPRFVGYGLGFGYSVAPLKLLDVALLVLALIWAWLVAMLWDVLTRSKLPFSVPSLRQSILRGYVHAPVRWRLAVSDALIEGIEAQYLLADRDYDSDAIAEQAQCQGMEVVIPPRKNRQAPRSYNKHLYRYRHLVENAFLQLKRWRGIATRYAKRAESFLAAVQIRCLALWLSIL